MSQIEKAIQRIKSNPKDYTYDEAKSLLEHFGFIEDNKGKTSGSRVKYQRKTDKKLIMLHKPHPGSIMKTYNVKELKSFLESLELI